MRKKIRVLVVDDSAFMRKLLMDIINSSPECEVIKTAKDGVEALRDVEELVPDVVTMDIQLPEIDGLTCVAYIMEKFPTPIVMVTGFSEFLGEETIMALEYGAFGLIRKPKSLHGKDMMKIQHELISEIKLASQVSATRLRSAAIKEIREKIERPTTRNTHKIVVVATSSGGPRALSQVIPKLPIGLPAGVLVVQHIPAEFVPSLADRLNSESALNVKIAEDQESIKQGNVLFAPPNFYCEIESKGKEGGLIRLVPVPREDSNHLVSADTPMISLAPIYGKNAVGVVLTGMGNDGTAGLRAIKKYGGYTIAEDESTCIVYGMPKSAIEAGVVNKVVPLHRMADEIVEAVGGRGRNWQ
jgi:two-component system chemotaxis response regulator CheB